MLNKIIKLLLIMVLFHAKVHGQQQRIDLFEQLGYRYTPSNTIKTESVILGSQYILDQFLPSKISCFKELTPPLRYNAYTDEIEFMKDGKLYNIIKKDSCEINLQDKVYSYCDYEDAGKLDHGYLVKLTNSNANKFQLFKKEKITLVPEYKPESSYQQSKQAYFKVEKEKFFLATNGKITNMPSKKKDILSLFPEHKELIETFLKEHKISFSEEINLIQLVDFLNNL